MTRSLTMIAPLSLPLSKTPSTRVSEITSAGRRQRLVDLHALFAVHDHQIVDARHGAVAAVAAARRGRVGMTVAKVGTT